MFHHATIEVHPCRNDWRKDDVLLEGKYNFLFLPVFPPQLTSTLPVFLNTAVVTYGEQKIAFIFFFIYCASKGSLQKTCPWCAKCQSPFAWILLSFDLSCCQKVSSIGLNGVWIERPTELSSLLNALSKVFPLQLRTCLLLYNAGEAVLISPSGFILEPLLRTLLGSFW